MCQICCRFFPIKGILKRKVCYILFITKQFLGVFFADSVVPFVMIKHCHYLVLILRPQIEILYFILFYFISFAQKLSVFVCSCSSWPVM